MSKIPGKRRISAADMTGWYAKNEGGRFYGRKQTENDRSELEAPADFTSPDVLYRDLVASIRKYHPSDDLSMVEKAYQLLDEYP